MFNPFSKDVIQTKDRRTGYVSEKPRPPKIGGAHELIHVLRVMQGKAIPHIFHHVEQYRGMTGKWRFDVMNKEEAATIGLIDVDKDSITENMIRKEQGLELRGAYSGGAQGDFKNPNHIKYVRDESRRRKKEYYK